MSPLFKTSQDIPIAGFECGTEFELHMVVTFTYHKEVPSYWINPPEPAFVEDIRPEFFMLIGGKVLGNGLVMPKEFVEQFTNCDSFKAWLISEAESQMEDAKAGMGL